MIHTLIKCNNLYFACQTCNETKLYIYNVHWKLRRPGPYPFQNRQVHPQNYHPAIRVTQNMPGKQKLHDSITSTEGILIYNGMVSADNDAKKYICWGTGHPSCWTLFLLRVCSMLRFVFSQWHVGSVIIRITGYTHTLCIAVPSYYVFHDKICLFSMACRLSNH